MVKTFKDLLLRNQEADDLENWYTASGTQVLPHLFGERGGSVVECRTPEREVRGSRPTAAVLCP